MFCKNKAIGLTALATNRKICIATVAALTLTGFSSRAQTADPTNPSGAADTTPSDQSSGTSDRYLPW
jgi:hypothetical protein